MKRSTLLLFVSAISFTSLHAQEDSTKVDKDYTLKGIEIKGQRQITRQKDDALVTDIAHSVLKDAGTAEDVLSHLPGIQQNEDKSFTVLGKGTPLVYINGRQVRDQSELDRLQSKDIKNVEVIRNPGSRYDATVKAVIRITTLKPKDEGWGFDARTAHWYGHHYGIINDLDFNYLHKGWNVFGTIHYNKGEDVTYNELSHILQGKSLWTQNAQSSNYTRQYTWQGRLGTNYTFNENHSLGFVYDIMYWHALSPHTTTEASVLKDGTSYDTWSTLQHKQTQYNPQHTLSLYYAGKVRKLSIDLNADMSWYNTKEELLDGETSAVYPDKNRTVTTSSKANSSLYAVKGILGYPLWKGYLTAGSEYTLTDRKNVFLNKEGILSNSDNNVKEHTLSAFAEYRVTMGKVSGAAGVRYEHNASDYYEAGVLVPAQSRTYDNIFPNVSLSFPAGPVAMNLSYTMKTQRPTYSQLDGNMSYVNRYEYLSGNPLLKPSKISDFSLTASYKFLQLTGSWQQHSDVIIASSNPFEDHENILYTSTYNFPRLQKWSVFLSAFPSVGVWHPIYTIGLLGQNFHLTHFGNRLSLNRPLSYVALTNYFTFPWKMQAGLDFYYTGRGHMNTILLKENAYVNMSVTQFFLKDKALSLKLAWNDVFNSMRNRTVVYAAQSLLNENDHWSDMSFVTLTVRYTFKSIKNKYKGTGAGEDEKKRL